MLRNTNRKSKEGVSQKILILINAEKKNRNDSAQRRNEKCVAASCDINVQSSQNGAVKCPERCVFYHRTPDFNIIQPVVIGGQKHCHHTAGSHN